MAAEQTQTQQRGDVEATNERGIKLCGRWLNRVTELAGWLEGDPEARFARLLESALGRDAHLKHQRMRRWYAYEITEQGLATRPAATSPDVTAVRRASLRSARSS